MEHITFIDSTGSFRINRPETVSGLYFPIAGEKGLKGAVTPNLGGDLKLDQNTFVMEPVSVDNLHNNRSGRNFWCLVEGRGIWSAVGASAEAENCRFTEEEEESTLTAGLMWHKMERSSQKYGLTAKVTSFVPLAHNVELMQVEITNTDAKAQTVTPVAAIPLYGRSADNIRDHRHVTSLLHRIKTTECGVEVKPTLSFDERGHQKNQMTYFVCGADGKGEFPVSFYPVTADYIGEGGTFTHPRALVENRTGVPAGERFGGKEAMGGLRFADVALQPGESICYTVMIGVTKEEEEIAEIVRAYRTAGQVEEALGALQQYWQEQVNVSYHTGDARFDNFMRWVSFQPFLRRIYGCSFLPHHDYGKGGRGWRDLWQDCLALLIMNPDGVRKMILDNYGGVRMDGTNATIIGTKPGEFIADRNNITRVWMDHGFWPFLTTKLYMEQTGDIRILEEETAYFKDRQVERGTGKDEEWSLSYGSLQKTKEGDVYQGSILEHLLLQNLCAFYEVGDHNHIRLRGADWNDAIDMAEERGESVAFTCAYAGNLKELASYLRKWAAATGRETVALAEEMGMLFAGGADLYDSVEKKRALLSEYTVACRHEISGRKAEFMVEAVAGNLEEKAEWMMEHIRKAEWIGDGSGNHWFNSYYDNHGNAVEGAFPQGVRMMLTGQVFAVMSGTATEEQVKAICKSADCYLYEREAGGYRLNTDFQEEKFDLGRMFGFAYGEKENGAVFSHMTVMYANALYQRGFVREGYQALKTLSDTALNFEVSKIYPGIPEYFDAKGRGLYHYLTGAASWYMLTMVTEAFGVRGENGNLCMEPKLVEEQFDAEGVAELRLPFANRSCSVRYHNKKHLPYGEYRIVRAMCGEKELEIRDGVCAVAEKEWLGAAEGSELQIEIELA